MIAFTLNGKTMAVKVAQGSLLTWLRQEQGLVAAKDGCSGKASCGACLVEVNGKACLACVTPLEKLQNAEIITLEGMSPLFKETLAHAFVHKGAVQCGFCTPGFITRAKILLTNTPNPSREDVVHAVRPHLCRCTGYQAIVDAILLAAKTLQSTEQIRLLKTSKNPTKASIGQPNSTIDKPIVNINDAKANIEPSSTEIDQTKASIEPSSIDTSIGASFPKVGAYERAIGTRPFVDDLQMDGMLHGALCFTPYPRARIHRIDTSKAQAIDGVVRVLTADDIPGTRVLGLFRKDWPVMVKEGEITRYIGDVLACVVANDVETARRALAAIELDVEELTGIFDMQSAEQMAEQVAKSEHDTRQMANSAQNSNSTQNSQKTGIIIHEAFPDNVMLRKEIVRGDLGDPYPPTTSPARSPARPIDSLLASCAHVAEATFITPQIEHAYLEVEACLAKPIIREHDFDIHLYVQSQAIGHDKDDIAALLNIPKDKVHVTLVDAGGAFGGKEDLCCQSHAALAAYHTKRPVKVCLNREESLRMHPKRHAMRLHYTLGCDEHGKLIALKARILADTGAYASAGAPVVTRTGTHASGAYFVPHVDVQVKAVFTNNVPAGAFRGFGVNQSNIAMECILDELCHKGGFDRWQFRYDNALDTGLMVTTGQVLDENIALKETLLAVRDAFRAHPRAGIACAIKNTGIGNGIPEPCMCIVEVMPDESLPDEGLPNEIVSSASLTLHHAWTEMGQGINTIAHQMLCESLRIPKGESVPKGENVPHTESVSHSEIFSKNIRLHITTSTEFGAFAGPTTASRGTFQLGHAILDATKKLQADLAKHGSLSELIGRRYEGHYDTQGQTSETGAPGVVRNHIAYSFATHVVFMDEKGRVERVIAAHDSGCVVNKALYEGQVCGGVAMGLGYALCEEFRTEKGQLLTKTLRDCKILRASDMPSVDCIAIEKPDTTAPFGAKGLGEIACIPTTAACMNAAFMVDGQRRTTLPLPSHNT